LFSRHSRQTCVYGGGFSMRESGFEITKPTLFPPASRSLYHLPHVPEQAVELRVARAGPVALEEPVRLVDVRAGPVADVVAALDRPVRPVHVVPCRVAHDAAQERAVAAADAAQPNAELGQLRLALVAGIAGYRSKQTDPERAGVCLVLREEIASIVAHVRLERVAVRRRVRPRVCAFCLADFFQLSWNRGTRTPMELPHDAVRERGAVER
jgi:hypothetical protein